MKGEEESSSEEEVTKEALLDDAESLLKEIDADKKKEHHGVFECEREGNVRRRMEFMNRAMEKQRQEARLEAEQLIQSLQEEKEFDQESEEEEEEPAESEAVKAALADGEIKRQKKKAKSLEVKEHIKVDQVRSVKRPHV